MVWEVCAVLINSYSRFGMPITVRYALVSGAVLRWCVVRCVLWRSLCYGVWCGMWCGVWCGVC